MVSRNGNRMDRQYPELSILPHHVNAKQAILDGEIAALDARGVPSFELLQQRIMVADASAIALLTRHHPVVLVRFSTCCISTATICGRAAGRAKTAVERSP